MVCVLLSFSIISPISVEALEKEENKHNDVIAVVTNMDTKQKMIVIPTEVHKTLKRNGKEQKDFSKEYEVELELPIYKMSTRASDSIGKTATKKRVKITGKFYYQTKSPDMVKVTSCSGSWKPATSTIYMTGREVVLHGGDGQHMKKKPTKNSFSYKTGWGFKPYVPQSSISGTGMIMTAVARVSGMTAKSEVQLHISGGDVLDNLK